jgi:peptidoglycan hydrolase CwlO-like protein
MDSFRTSSDHMKGSTTIIQPANNNDVAKEKEAYDKRNARIANGEDSITGTRFDNFNNNPRLMDYDNKINDLQTKQNKTTDLIFSERFNFYDEIKNIREDINSKQKTFNVNDNIGIFPADENTKWARI